TATRGSAVLGPYGGAVGRGYHLSAALHWIAYQAGDVLLLVMGIPLVAAIALTVSCIQRRESDRICHLVAVLVPSSVLLVLEAGIYISRYEGRINERTMVTLVPPFFVALAVWLDRGMPRARATVIAVAAVGVAACFWPVEKLVVSATVPDSF